MLKTNQIPSGVYKKKKLKKMHSIYVEFSMEKITLIGRVVLQRIEASKKVQRSLKKFVKNFLLMLNVRGVAVKTI